MARLPFWVVLLGFAFPLYGSLHAEEVVNQPYELVRSLRLLQDQIANGSYPAHRAQRLLMSQITEQLAKMPAETWKYRLNLNAALIFVLSGGPPDILRQLMNMDVISTEDAPLVKGVLAYGEGRVAPAEKFLGEVDARKLQASLAGQIALAQAVLATQDDPAKAIRLLDEARLLSPGSLVEESALRREALLLVSMGNLPRFEYMMNTYARRFRNSLYSPAFFRQFAIAVAKQKLYGSDPQRVKRLDDVLGALDKDELREVYLAMAEEAVMMGNLNVAIYAAGGVVKMVDEGSQPYLRAKLYESAALLLTENYGKGVEQLKLIDKTKLNERDERLLNTALEMAAKLRWPPEPPASLAVEPAEDGEGSDKDDINGVALSRKTRVKARRIISEVDKLLEQKTIGGEKK